MNKKAIIFSLIILLIIGALRLFIMMFSEGINEKSTRIRIELGDKAVEVDALIDTGNLVKDPMNMNPVIFVKKSSAGVIFPQSVIELSHTVPGVQQDPSFIVSQMSLIQIPGDLIYIRILVPLHDLQNSVNTRRSEGVAILVKLQE